MQPLEELDDKLSQMWAVVSHLNAVCSNEELRIAYDACLPKISDYSTEMGQNIALFNAIKSIKAEEFNKLNPAQQKVVENELRDFHLAGVNLAPEAKKNYGD